ncbi:hypothetical protein AHAS_Ahas03G0162900 [Arachis hypogaea]
MRQVEVISKANRGPWQISRVPLIYSRVTRNTYKEVEAQINARLNNWKASSLFLARRTTLKDIESKSIWRIGDRSHIDFWKHQWVPSLERLDQQNTQVTNYSESGSSLTDFLSVSSAWDINKLKEWLSEAMVHKIVSLFPPSPWKQEGHIA